MLDWAAQFWSGADTEPSTFAVTSSEAVITYGVPLATNQVLPLKSYGMYLKWSLAVAIHKKGIQIASREQNSVIAYTKVRENRKRRELSMCFVDQEPRR